MNLGTMGKLNIVDNMSTNSQTGIKQPQSQGLWWWKPYACSASLVPFEDGSQKCEMQHFYLDEKIEGLYQLSDTG